MKKNPGKYPIFITLFIALQLFAKQPADFSLTANKTTAYVKEAVEITFTATQTDYTNVMFFFLDPEKSDAYEIDLLRKEIVDHSYHHNTTTFTYILFPLKPGKIDVHFDFTVKTASDRGVAQAYVEDHDDSKGIKTDALKIALSPLTLTVKPLEKPVDLVGDFTLDHSLDRSEADAFDTVNLTYTLKGTGYEKGAAALLKPIEGVSIFSDRDDAVSKLTPNGYRQQKVYYYALSSRKDFTIPPLTLTAYSPDKGRYYKLTAPSFPIKVNPIDTKELLDTTSSPASQTIRAADIGKWAVYFLLFAAGFVSAKLMPSKIIRKRTREMFSDIRAAQDPKSLAVILTSRYRSKAMETYIEQLEALAYAKEGSGSYKAIKDAVLKTLRQER